MASCTQIKRTVQAYIDGELGASEKVILEQHLTACRACRKALGKTKANAALLFEALGARRLDHDLTESVMAHLPEMDRVLDPYTLGQRNTDRTTTVAEVNWRAKHPRDRAFIFTTLVPALAPILLLVFALAIVYSWPPSELSGKDDIGMVTQREGTVLRSEDDGPERHGVVLQHKVAQNQRFETRGDASLMITLAGMSQVTQVKVDANSRVKIFDHRQIQLDRGRIWLDISKDKRLFRVKTLSGSITVFGTKFCVDATLDDRVFVTVVEGEVMVDNESGGYATLTAGEQTVLSQDGQPLRLSDVDTSLVTKWADAIQPDMEAMEQFAAVIKPPSVVLRAEHAYILRPDQRAVQFILLEWPRDQVTSDHCAYDLFLFDEFNKLRLLERISARTLNNPERDSYEIAVPEEGLLAGANLLSVKLVPVRSSGDIETTFTVSAY